MTDSDVCRDRGNFLEGLKRTATNQSGQPVSSLNSSSKPLKKKQERNNCTLNLGLSLIREIQKQ